MDTAGRVSYPSDDRKCAEITKNLGKNRLYRESIHRKVRPPLGRAMKVLSSLNSLKRRHAGCQIVKRRGTLYVINKTNPKFKARQGSTRGTRLSKKGVK